MVTGRPSGELVRRDDLAGRELAGRGELAGRELAGRDDLAGRELAGRDALPPGSVIMPHGRLSEARELLADQVRGPFTAVQLARLDEALTLASRSSRLLFSLYLGDLGAGSRARAEELHAATPDPASAVLIAVSPGQRMVEVVTGEESAKRLPNHACRLAVMAMVASFKEGDLVGGLVSGLRMLADQAGRPPA